MPGGSWIPVVVSGVSVNEIGREASHCFSNGFMKRKSILAREKNTCKSPEAGGSMASPRPGGGQREASGAAVQGVRARMG